MAKLPKDEGGDFEIAPAGSHLAVCYRVIDLGTQQSSYQGEITLYRKLLIMWELPDERMSDGRPFIISSQYTWSMSERANLRKDLEAWRGRGFTEEDFETFDTENLLGVPCLLNVVHRPAKDGSRVYANIGGIGPLPRGMKWEGTTKNEMVHFWICKEDLPKLEKLSERLRRKIESSPEYQEVMRGHGLPRQDTPPTSAPADSALAELNDEIPF
jgi:hypothetical protein